MKKKSNIPTFFVHDKKEDTFFLSNPARLAHEIELWYEADSIFARSRLNQTESGLLRAKGSCVPLVGQPMNKCITNVLIVLFSSSNIFDIMKSYVYKAFNLNIIPNVANYKLFCPFSIVYLSIGS